MLCGQVTDLSYVMVAASHRESSRHTPCAVTELQKKLTLGGRHTECACYFGFAETL